MEGPLVIVGANGMLGQDLAREFADLSPDLLDKDDMDITNFEVVKTILGETGATIVINAAAYNLVDDAEDPKGEAIARLVNVEGPRNLAKACRALGATLIHYSSDYVFAGDDKQGYVESAETSPQSGYARSKRDGELAVLEENEDAYVVRTCKLFGAPGISEGSKKSFVDVMLSLAETRDTLDVVDEEYASPTYTPDLAAQTRVLLEGGFDPGIYHMTNTGACTWYEFAQEIFRLSGKDIKLNPVTADAFPRPAARPKYSQLLNTKLPEMRSWQDGLAGYLSTL